MDSLIRICSLAHIRLLHLTNGLGFSIGIFLVKKKTPPPIGMGCFKLVASTSQCANRPGESVTPSQNPAVFRLVAEKYRGTLLRLASPDQFQVIEPHGLIVPSCDHDSALVIRVPSPMIAKVDVVTVEAADLDLSGRMAHDKAGPARQSRT